MVRIIFFLFVFIIIMLNESSAQVSVKPTTTQVCVNTAKTLNNIVLTEGSATPEFDLSDAPLTLIFIFPDNSLTPGVGDPPTFSDNTVITGITVLHNQVEVSLMAVNSNHQTTADVLTISGLQFTSGTPGPIEVQYNGGTLSVTGLATNTVVANINVNAAPSFTPTITGGPQVVCQNSEHTYTTEGGATSYQWTYSGSIPNGSITDQSIAVQWIGEEKHTISVEHTLPTGCTVSSATFTASFPSASNTTADICSGESVNFDLQNYYMEDGVPSFEWYASVDSKDVTGETTLAAPETSSTITDLLNSSSASSQMVSYTVNATIPGLEACPSTFYIDVSINAKPTLNTPAPEVCSDTDLAIALETDAASVPATTYNINSIIPSGTLTPGVTNTIVATGYSFTAIQTDKWMSTSPANETVTYVIAPVSDGGCSGDPASLVVTIKPAPTVTATNNAPMISAGSTTNISLSSNAAGATFEYTFAGPVEITGGSSGSGSTINQTLDNSVSVQQTVTYSIAATANGCTGLFQVATVFIKGNPTISQADSLALVQLYNATNGASWTEQTNWLTGAADTWFGIGVTSERVTAVTLPTNNLTGTLPAEIGNLTNLGVLNLHQNNIGGTIPAEVYSLTDLTELSLGSNQFTGSISPLVGDLVNLQILRFENLPMTGSVPAEVFNLTGLETLGLSGRLNGPVPASIGAITGLTEFSCDNCGITALPSQINTLTNLTTLSLPDNELTTLPVISALPLSSFDVSENWLTFESIEPIIATPGLVYAPQDSVGTKINITIQTETPYSITSSVGGSANQYQWKKNTVPIPAVTAANYTITSPSFEDEGSYIAEVTNPLVPGLTLVTRPVNLKVSSLKRDSLSLVQVYEKTHGDSWTNKAGWITGNLSTWAGVTISSNRVTAIDLSNNNLDGKVPAGISDMLSLTNINMAANKLTSLPSLTSLTQLTTVNVSANKLGFGSLEPNVSILDKINYANQADLGTIKKDSIESGSLVKLKAITDGMNNTYQWKKNGSLVAEATDSTYVIASIGRTTMGEYVCEITNPTVPGLMLKSAAHTVLASTDLSGRLFIETNTPATNGKITLFRVTASEAYDTIKVIPVKDDGSFEFKKVILDDYQLLGFADTAIYERALPTYYQKTIFWEEADTLVVNSSLTGLDIVSELEPGVPSGKGMISGFVEEDDGTGSGRVKKPKRVESAGVSARRVENTGRGKEEILTLVAYVFTNANGEFAITNLLAGEYRLNIQYPGYPMNEKSFVTVPIGNALQSQVHVEALVEEGHITVRQLIITEIMNTEGYNAEVFPNPSHDFIEVTFGSVSAYREIGMLDTMGKRISTANASDTLISLDIRSLPKGNYLLTITEKGNRVKSLHVIIE
jgi:Leucine-rich repeat (LRR) protein